MSGKQYVCNKDGSAKVTRVLNGKRTEAGAFLGSTSVGSMRMGDVREIF